MSDFDSDPGPPADRHDRFAKLYHATYTALLRFVERRVAPAHAEDVVADVFLVAWRRFDEVPRPVEEARAWLYGVAHRTLRNRQRTDRRREALTVRIADAATVSSGLGSLDPDLVATRVDLAAAWRRLSPLHQETLALTVWDGLTSPQAAAVLDISPVAYRLRLTRARRALRRYAEITASNSHADLPLTRSTS